MVTLCFDDLTWRVVLLVLKVLQGLSVGLIVWGGLR